MVGSFPRWGVRGRGCFIGASSGEGSFKGGQCSGRDVGGKEVARGWTICGVVSVEEKGSQVE